MLLLFAASLRGSPPPVNVEVNRGTAAEWVSRLLEQRAAGGFGGAIIVEKDGQIVMKGGYGWADREREIPFTTETIAQIGSLTKQFTAAAALDLWQKGRIDLNEPLAKYVEGIPRAAEKITIHELLTHTSGLPRDCGADFAVQTRRALIRDCLALARGPSGRFSYSNLGYSAIGVLVETMERRALEQVIADRFLKPLRMTRTGYFFPPSFRDSMASGYAPMGPQAPISERLTMMKDAFWNLKGNGGMQASVNDMYRWYRALSAPSLIHSAVKEKLMSPHAHRDANISYGYGWYLRAAPNGTIEQVSHTGSDGVFLAAFVWRPVDRLFIYFVTNRRGEDGSEIVSIVLRRFRGIEDQN